MRRVREVGPLSVPEVDGRIIRWSGMGGNVGRRRIAPRVRFIAVKDDDVRRRARLPGAGPAPLAYLRRRGVERHILTRSAAWSYACYLKSATWLQEQRPLMRCDMEGQTGLGRIGERPIALNADHTNRDGDDGHGSRAQRWPP